jgi:outer membrane protein TolC
MVTPAAYKEFTGANTPLIDDVIGVNWWEIFNDAEINALEQQVDISNQNIAQAEARFRQARALVQSARAAYYPTVAVGIGVSGVQSSETSQSRNPKQPALLANTHCPLMFLGNWMSGVESVARSNPMRQAPKRARRISKPAD